MRWSEVTGLQPDYVLADVLDIQEAVRARGGHFYRGRPKDGSIRPADLPPFLAELLAWHTTHIKGRRCTCRKFDASTGPASGTTWCTGGEYIFLSPGGSHYRRSTYGERYFHPAADGWYPERSHRSARPVLIDTSAVSRLASRSVARSCAWRRVRAADRPRSCAIRQRPRNRSVRCLPPCVPAPPRRSGDLSQEQR